MRVNFAHQTALFNRFKDQRYGGIFAETGTGKSRVGLQLLEHHYKMDRITAGLIITTKTLTGVWAWDNIPDDSTLPYTIYLWDKSRYLPPPSRMSYVIVNVDAVLTPRFKKFYAEFIKTHPKFALLFDESTKVKNRNAQRTIAVTAIARNAQVRLIMAGYAVVQGPLDLYSQAEILKPGLLGSSFYSFRGRYCNMAKILVKNKGEEQDDKKPQTKRAVQVIANYKNLDELGERIKEWSMVVRKKDCLDLPPKLYKTVKVELTKEQRRAYEELTGRGITYIKENVITAINGLSLVNRLMQICAGQMKIKETGEYVSIPTEKTEATLELLAKAEKAPTIIWSSFTGATHDLTAAIGPSCLHIPSGLTAATLYSRLELFRNGSYSEMIGNPASLAHGITLVNSSNTIFANNTCNSDHRRQAEDRNHRIGQVGESVLYTDLVTRGTVEGKVVKVLKDKENLADLVLDKARFIDFLTDVGDQD